ncbi:MAG: hypothetical protein JO316_15155 [Abitibacteriaceae bacterium]|nr:hypothetical protein [Abditibacteriaceae bacterium]MBV9866690.1 hypothetical protein [Abditibacteriaceae bacterium]
MPRNCNCSGGCGPQQDGADGVTRREFITLVGAGTAGLLLHNTVGAQAAETRPVSAQTVDTQVTTQEIARWKKALFEPAAPRLYRSDTHTDARMHLGGIGTGNFDIGVDGQFLNWQLFNTLRDGYVPFYFAVRSGNTAKLLQTTGGPDWPRIRQIEMTGEYPLATLRFRDADLPVQLELTAFTPFAPLDSRLSSMPVAAFVFRVHNPTSQLQKVSLAAFMQNPVGYDAQGEIRGVEHPNFGGNVNEITSEGNATVLSMRAVPGQAPTLDKPIQLYTNLNLAALHTPPVDRPQNLTVQALDRIPTGAEPGNSPGTVIWLENAPTELSDTTLRTIHDAVQAGATLVFAGHEMPLLHTYGQLTGGKPLQNTAGRPDILFEDFETDYSKWTVEGTAFGERPPAGTQPNQQVVSGFEGKRLVNSYRGTDGVTGRLISKPFTIERDFIRFLVGGGSEPSTQIRLIFNGKTVRTASGRNEERLAAALWDVRDFSGQQAHLEIVDDSQGPWGHINVDHIQFTDVPGSQTVMQLLQELLPARFSGVQAANATSPNTVTFQNLELLAGSHQSTTHNGLQIITHAVGKGQVTLAAGPLIRAGGEPYSRERQEAYALVSELAGAQFTTSNGTLPTAPGFGTLALATSGPNAGGMEAFADWMVAFTDWQAGRRFLNAKAPRSAYSVSGLTLPPTAPGHTVNGALASTVTVAPGQTVEVPFFLTWHYPNKYSHDTHVGNHYTTLWPNARAVMQEAVANFSTLRARTEQFRITFYDSPLPYWMLDCISSQASTIRHVGVVFRIANSDIYGWEGSNGCCDPTCTHVWGYEQSLARLFPDLEKEMRRIDYKHQQSDDGGINNRTAVPSPPQPSGEHPFVDGHASCILKAYREALNHPDDSWLREYWPGIQRAVEYLIKRDAATSGGKPTGILEDDQWNTYDEALHGVTTFIGTYYLAALRAGEELARRRGDNAAANRYHSIFEQGQKRLIDLCWNGEYFQQHLTDYEKRNGEIGPGCMSDQLIGQWWAHQLGLGYVLPQEMVQKALKSVFKYNWLPDHTNWQHNWRKFAGGRDKGLLICTWPKGGRPANPMLYVDEVWTGIEYQVAGHMIYEGMVDEAFAIIKGARDRYDGIPSAPMPRSPWNEFECGGHYARAMSSWSILLAMSGWHYDGMAQSLRFAPRYSPANFKTFWSGPEGWGSISQTRNTARDGRGQSHEITAVEGNLRLAFLHLDAPDGVKRVQAQLGGKRLATSNRLTTDGLAITFDNAVILRQGQTLNVNLT